MSTQGNHTTGTLPVMPEGAPEITCDRCVAPGTCCKAFPLSFNFRFGVTIEELNEWLEMNKMPFKPLVRDSVWCGSGGNDQRGVWLEQWRFSCPKLGEDGLCTIYEDRPDLCKDYAPGIDRMCVHMRGPNGLPIIPQLPMPLVIPDILTRV